MAYGKLVVLKSYGEKPVFVVEDGNGNQTNIPDFAEWLFRRIGHDVNVFISDTYFQVCDEVERKKT
jgi:hypothetical protein